MKKRWKVAVAALALAAFAILSAAFASAEVVMVEPLFGVGNQSAFNISVTTSSAASCRYSSPFEKPFAEMAEFSATGGTAHKLLNFPLPTASQAYKFYVECSDSEKKAFDVSADFTSPFVTKLYASPAAIIETPLETRIILETSEDAVCRYDSRNNHYDTMEFKFEPSDQDRANYRKEHQAVITGLADKTDYNYGVMCVDLSQRLSGLYNVTFRVDTSVPAAITEILPKSGFATTSPEVNLSVTTNKRSVCFYGNTTEYKENGGNFSTVTLNHQVTLKPEARQHRYYVRCLFEGPKELTSETTFTYDSTPPVLSGVNDSQEGVEEGYAYRLDRLKVRFTAEDNESGIDLYYYAVIEESTGVVVINWTATKDNPATIRELRLKDGERYYVIALAQNRAGLRSEVIRSRGVAVNVFLNSEYACGDGVKDGDESDIDCGGPCAACSTGKLCSSASDCGSRYCVAGKCAKGNCTDSYLNQDETDVDCGGSCSLKCDTSQKCKKNADCSANICSEGLCAAEGPCSNKVLDGGETDVDCGGLCAAVKGKKCATGQGCGENSDCKSAVCTSSGKCASRTDLDGDSILNEADLCPETPNTDPRKKQADADGDKTGDECDTDNDNDGLPDEWEKKFGLNRLDAEDALLDADGDGLSNLQEHGLGTSPKSRDTDRDGADDDEEVEKGTDPANSKSKPPGGFAAKATLVLFLLVLAIGLYSGYVAIRRRVNSLTGQAPPPYQPAAPQQQRHHQPLQHHPAQPEQPHRSHHEVFENLERTYSQLSGDELFDHLRRKTGRR